LSETPLTEIVCPLAWTRIPLVPKSGKFAIGERCFCQRELERDRRAQLMRNIGSETIPPMERHRR
jgi:hypothetical protein